MTTRMNFQGRRTERQEFAAKSAEEREKRGDAGQLARLEADGHGHCQEAVKLRGKLDQLTPDEKEQLNHLGSLARHLERVVAEGEAT